MVIVIVITVIFTASIVVWLARFSVGVPSVGTIYVAGAEAYGGDIKPINGVPSIDWGTIQCGDSKNVTFYLRSISNVQIRLAFAATDWNPEGLKNYVTLSWNYSGTQLAPKQEIPICFTLSTPDTRDFANYIVTNNVKLYNFTIYIYAQK